MIELRSGQGLEYTNSVHFVGCRCESYPGIAIALSGRNTNKIFLTNCKLESLASSDPALLMQGAKVVSCQGVQITGRGSSGATLRALVAARQCSFLLGDITLEHAAWGGQAASLECYMDLVDVLGAELSLYAIDSQRSLAPEAYVRLRRSSGVEIRGFIRQSDSVRVTRWTA